MKKIILLLVLLSTSTLFSQDFKKGKELFKQNCAACHNMEKKMVGPALQNVVQDQGRDWTKKWIYNSQALIQEGDDHAVEVWNEYNKIAMPAYNWMNDGDLESVVTYLEDYTKDKEERMAALNKSKEGETKGQVVVSAPQPTPTYLKVILGIAFIVILVCLYGLYKGLSTIITLVSDSTQTNKFLMDKIGINKKDIQNELDSTIEKEVSKRLNEKVKNLKKDLDQKLKEYK